jgi:hypothetical protein
VIYTDTSFIASAFGLDANTAAARSFIEASKPCLPLVFFTGRNWPKPHNTVG